MGLARAVIPGRGDRVIDVTIRISRPTSVVIHSAAGSWGGGRYFARIDGLLVSLGDWSSDDPFLVPSGSVSLEITEEQSGRHVFRTLDTPPGGTVTIDLASDEK